MEVWQTLRFRAQALGLQRGAEKPREGIESIHADVLRKLMQEQLVTYEVDDKPDLESEVVDRLGLENRSRASWLVPPPANRSLSEAKPSTRKKPSTSPAHSWILPRIQTCLEILGKDKSPPPPTSTEAVKST